MRIELPAKLFSRLSESPGGLGVQRIIGALELSVGPTSLANRFQPFAALESLTAQTISGFAKCSIANPPFEVNMLTSKQKKILKAEAHHLKPVLHIGKEGVTEALAQEIDVMLDSLELIKVKLNSNTAEDEASAVSGLQKSVPGLEHVWTIGHTLLFFRPSRTHPTRYSI